MSKNENKMTVSNNNIKNYTDLANEMKKDEQFKKFIHDITIQKLKGDSLSR